MPRKNTQIARICQHCGKEFRVSPCRLKPENGGAKYCSRACRGYGVGRSAVSHKIECVCVACGATFSAFPSKVKAGGGKYCCRACADIGQKTITGAMRPYWKDGSINAEGYRVISVNGVQVLEHRHVMATILKRPLRADEVVHHVNGKKTDNHAENLQVMSNSDHLRLHWEEWRERR